MGSGRQAMNHGYPNGATRRERSRHPEREAIPGELKHLSNRRKRNQHENPQVAASEKGRAQTEDLRVLGVADLRKRKSSQRKRLGKRGEESETLVRERMTEREESRVPRGTRNPVGSRVDHHPRRNTTERPIEEVP